MAILPYTPISPAINFSRSCHLDPPGPDLEDAREARDRIWSLDELIQRSKERVDLGVRGKAGCDDRWLMLTFG